MQCQLLPTARHSNTGRTIWSSELVAGELHMQTMCVLCGYYTFASIAKVLFIYILKNANSWWIFKGHQYVPEVTAKKGTKLASENVRGSRKEPSSWHGRARGCNPEPKKGIHVRVKLQGNSHIAPASRNGLWPDMGGRGVTKPNSLSPSLFKNCKLQAILSAPDEKWTSITLLVLVIK